MHLRYHLSVIFLFCWLAASAQSITRGPYWQVVTPTSAIVRWRTDQPTTGRVWFGTNVSQLTTFLRETQPTQEHILTVSNLQPATRYAYAVGYDETKLASGPDYYLKTAPVAGTTLPIRLWVLGDFGNGSDNQKRVYESFQKATTTRPADLWLWLGDNAYCCGIDDQYQRNIFDVYGPTLRNTPFYPTPGNHDYNDNNVNLNVDYYRAFTMPQKGEAGGLASGTSTYFSADYGNVHIISLDAFAQQAADQKELNDSTSVQVQWLKRDLVANKLPWTIVTFHHPLYTKGPRDSDTEERMKLLRERLSPIFEKYGVDLVMNGHSHTYERFYRMHGQTGLSTTFDPAKHITENTTARYDGSPNSCPILTKGVGTVYIVAGSGGENKPVSPTYPHPGMVAGFRGELGGGSVLLDVTENRIDGQFLAFDGSVPDRFTIVKNVNKRIGLTVKSTDTLQLTASWPLGDYRWITGETTRSIRLPAQRAAGQLPITVSDGKGCLLDEFEITVLAPPVVITATEDPLADRLRIFPNPTHDRVSVDLSAGKRSETSVRLTDLQGRVIYQKNVGSVTSMSELVALPTAGIFLLQVQVGNQRQTQQVIRH
ncbi:MAG: metallophosphoesterase [Spirosoma sp.]|nr:metallophosphoesterase [Spirosoma sp.]